MNGWEDVLAGYLAWFYIIGSIVLIAAIIAILDMKGREK